MSIAHPAASWRSCEQDSLNEQQQEPNSRRTSMESGHSRELEECFTHAQQRSSGITTVFDSFILFSGVPPRRPWVPCNGLCACFKAVYVVLFMVACLGWMILHCYFVLAKNDNMVTGHGEVQRYGWLYSSAFCCPSVDGMLNLAFAVMLMHGRQTQSPEGYKTLVRGFSQNWQRDRHVFYTICSTMLLVLARIAYNFTYGKAAASFLLSCGSMIEFLPHVAPFLLIHREIVNMRAVLESLRVRILGDRIAPGRCVAVYKDFHQFVRSVSARWQIFLMLSVGMEVYIIIFQSMWSFLNHDPSEKHSDVSNGLNTSLLTLTEGCFIAFKLSPLVSFNHKVKRFANDLIIAAQEKEDNELCVPYATEQAARLQKAASTTALLFGSRPPCLTICGFSIDTTSLASILISVMFTSIGRYIFAVAEQV